MVPWLKSSGGCCQCCSVLWDTISKLVNSLSTLMKITYQTGQASQAAQMRHSLLRQGHAIDISILSYALTFCKMQLPQVLEVRQEAKDCTISNVRSGLQCSKAPMRHAKRSAESCKWATIITGKLAGHVWLELLEQYIFKLDWSDAIALYSVLITGFALCPDKLSI